MLELRNVTYAYPGAESPALKGLSLSVAPGERVVLRGANGSGKSTAGSLLNGTLLPTEGEVLLDGASLSRESATRFAQLVGVVRQDPLAQLVEPTVFEEVAFGPQCLGLPASEVRMRATTALDACGLAGLKRRSVFELSGGQQQLCALAGVLAMEPAYLVLDEAGSHLDRKGRTALRRVIDAALESGVGVLQISHDERDAKGADHVLELRRTQEGNIAVPMPALGSASRHSASGPITGVSEPLATPLGAREASSGALTLAVEHVSFGYEGVSVLKDVSLHVHAGELALICGASGVGKTTLARIMSGVVAPESGTVSCAGEPVRPGTVGLVMQRAEDQLFAASVREDVAYGPRNLGLSEAEVGERVEQALGALAVPRELWDESPFALSGGMRRRVALAGIVALRARAYVFDEPSAGLDAEGAAALHGLVARLLADGAAVAIVTHNPREWAYLAGQTLQLDHVEVHAEPREDSAAGAAVQPAEKTGEASARSAVTRSLDGRASLVGVLLLTVALFVAQGPLELVPVIAASLGLAVWAHVRRRDLARMCKPAAILAAFMLASQALVLDGSFDLQILGSFGVSVGGATRGLFSVVRILGLVVLASVAAKAVSSTSPTTLASSFMAPCGALGLRTDGATMAIAVTLRMMPEVTHEFDRITTAQRSRAGHLDEGGVPQRLRSYASVLVPLIVSLMQRSDDLARAMHDRCYTGSLTRLDEPLKLGDMLLIASVVVVLIAVCVL